MIFVTAASKLAMFLMLTDKDIQTLREGRTLFVDERATKAFRFTEVILSLHANHEAALTCLRQAGYDPADADKLVVHERLPHERQCAGCQGLMDAAMLFEGRCTVCWATEAKQLRQARN